MLFEVNKNGRSATSGVGAIAVSASAVKHNAGRDAVFNATLNANIIKVIIQHTGICFANAYSSPFIRSLTYLQNDVRNIITCRPTTLDWIQ